MTVVAVLADPPREGLVCSSLVAETPLSAAQAVRLYEAALVDTCRAVDRSGGDLIVNYRPADLLPDEYADCEAKAAVRDALGDAVEDPRLEPQVGSTPSARVGNTITHLLDSEDARTAAVLDPLAPLVERTHVDDAAMQLRRHDAVLGPATGGRVYYAGFAEPIDFTDALAPPELETLTDRAADADAGVGFLSSLPSLATPAGLVELVTTVRARERAGAIVPTETATAVTDIGLRVVADDGERGVTVAD
jgi:hypothetical protein